MKARFLLAPLLFSALAACGDAGTGEQKSEVPAAAPEQTQPGAEAAAANAADSIRTRQTHYKAIGRAMKGINDELKKDAPELAVIREHAATINRFAPQIEGWFPDGTGAGAGVKTEAREEIWSKPEEFRKAAADFVQAAATFDQVAASGDIDGIRAGVKPLGAACKACHEQFRAED